MNRIPLEWVDSGPPEIANSYGKVISTRYANDPKYGEEPIPVICGHGGTMWLCESCVNTILSKGGARLATEDELAWFSDPRARRPFSEFVRKRSAK